MDRNRNEFTEAVRRADADTDRAEEAGAKKFAAPFMFVEKSAREMRTWLKNHGEAERQAYRQSVDRETMIQQAKQMIKEQGL